MPSVTALPSGSIRTVRWTDVVLPKEHGSWSLAAEPLALGLIAAPSVSGGWLAIAALAGFLARRPLKLALRERLPARRQAAHRALGVCSTIALTALAAAVSETGGVLLLWLLAPALLGGVFLFFDLRNEGREERAEIAGSAAFGSLAGAFAVAAGWPAWSAAALTFAMWARAIPTVLFVRAYLRANKTGERRLAAPLASAAAACAIALLLARNGWLPAVAAVASVVLAARSAVYLLTPGLRVRARTLGFQELALGLAYVVVVGVGWPA